MVEEMTQEMVNKMTQEMVNKMNVYEAGEYLEAVFARAGKRDDTFKTHKEQLKYQRQTGAQTFKRRALGLCGHRTIKNLDEVAQLFIDTNIASSLDEARELVPKVASAYEIQNSHIMRGIKFGLTGVLGFEEAKDSTNNIQYKITAFRYEAE